jgi:uncharacterized damage-inducible protein DinB
MTINEVRVPPFYDNYIKSNITEDLQEALLTSRRKLLKLAKKISEKQSDFAYAEGKWTIKELLQHIIDVERVFCYRALSFVRKDAAPLPGFDENSWAANSKAFNRKWKDLVSEFKSVRKASIAFFENLDDEQLSSAGIANNNESNVIGIGFVVSGHVLHHCKIIKERYLNRN